MTYYYRLFVNRSNGETEVTFRDIKKGEIFQFPFGDGTWNLALRDSSLWEMNPDNDNDIREDVITYMNIGKIPQIN